jgi:hypothetical protein
MGEDGVQYNGGIWRKMEEVEKKGGNEGRWRKIKKAGGRWREMKEE